MISSLFDREFLKKLEYLNLISKRLKGDRRAQRRRLKRGAGLEFADYRSYVAGDDFRHLDWKAYLRLNRLILKLFEEKEDRPIHFLIDTSRSMNSGQPPKLDYVRRVAAALCYISLSNLERVNIASFADRINGELLLQRGKARVFRVLRFLDGMAAEGATSAAQSFKAYCARRARRGLVVLISDLFDQEGIEGALDVLRHYGHDVFVIHVTSRDEVDPALDGELQLVDAESLVTREVTVTPSLLAAYRVEFGRYCDAIEDYCGRYQLGYIRAASDVPFEDVILNVLRQGRFSG